MDGGDVPHVPAPSPRRPSRRRSGDRHRGAATVQTAEAPGREAVDEDRGSVAAVSFGRLLVPVAEPPQRAGDQDLATKVTKDTKKLWYLMSSCASWLIPAFQIEQAE